MIGKKKLAALVGIENVTENAIALGKYAVNWGLTHPIRPLGIVKPGSTEEVQSIVEWAKKTKTPLTPVSSGPPRFHGGSVPSVGGTLIVDLSRMKKIVRVDRKNRIALIEPGVTFDELIQELAKENLAPFLPLIPRKSKSVVASVIEREPITMPRYHWESQDPLRCLEVVFGSGDLFRTGSAAGPGSLEDQWKMGKAQTRPYGPSFTDLAKIVQGAQGTMGIVTWASIACRPLPTFKKTYFVPSDRLNTLVELTYKLLWKKLGQDCFILNRRQLTALLGKKGLFLSNQTSPTWILVFSIEGFGLLPEERVAYQEADLLTTAQSFGLSPQVVLKGIEAREFGEIISRTSVEPYWKLSDRGGCHDVFFLTNLERTPQFVTDFSELASTHRYDPTDIGVYIQPTVQGVNCHCEFSLYYNPNNQNEKEIIRGIDADLSRSLAAKGAFFSRPYGHWADFAYGQNAQTVILQRKIKGILDPLSIMNPGKLCF